ncbi:hypothetical protein [Aureivirga marina]|uniref:hypothetical protein n=1 Tax=Aureivirga marina TaxID=1182451 RepID=UPI0018CA32BC|nr:hypothetical protein [Aureivirga marina]
MRKLKLSLIAITLSFFAACSSDDDSTTTTQQQQQEQNDENQDESNTSDDNNQNQQSLSEQIIGVWNVTSIDLTGDVATGGVALGDISGIGKNITLKFDITDNPKNVVSTGDFDLHATINMNGNTQDISEENVDYNFDSAWIIDENAETITIQEPETGEDIVLQITEISDTELTLTMSDTQSDDSTGVALDITTNFVFKCIKN